MNKYKNFNMKTICENQKTHIPLLIKVKLVVQSCYYIELESLLILDTKILTYDKSEILTLLVNPPQSVIQQNSVIKFFIT